MPSRKLTKRGILQVTHLSDHDIHKARNLSAPTPPPPSAYFQRHHKARHSFDSATGDAWLPPLQLGAPAFSSPGPLQQPANHSLLLLDVDWDPHYCLHNPAHNRQTKPKFTIGADDLGDDDPPAVPRHRPPFTRRHADFALTDNTKYSLTMAMMDDSISDESLIKLLEDAVIFNSPPISPSASHVEPTPASASTSPPFNLGLSPSTIRLITHDLSTSPPSSSSIPSPHRNDQTTFNLPLTSSNGDPRSRPLPPLPSPTREYEYSASTHVAGIHIPRHHDHHYFHPYHSLTPHHTHRIYPHHPTFRRALLTVRELIRTEKTYLDSLKLLLDYPSPLHTPKPSPALPSSNSQIAHYEDEVGPGEDDLSSNSHSPSRSTSFAHSSYIQHHPFPKHTQTTKPHSKPTSNMGDVDASKYTPPPLMRAYVVELAKVSESLVMRMERDLCVRGVAGAFVELCDLAEVGGEGKATTATVGSAEWEANLAYPHASLENVYVAWSGVVGSWFADTHGDGAREEEEARLRRKKEKGGDGRRRLSKTRRLSMLVGNGSSVKEDKRNLHGYPASPIIPAHPSATPLPPTVPSYSADASPSILSSPSPPLSSTKPPVLSGTQPPPQPPSQVQPLPNLTPNSSGSLTPAMRSKSSSSLKRTMSQWRKSLPSVPSISGLLSGSSSSSSTSTSSTSSSSTSTSATSSASSTPSSNPTSSPIIGTRFGARRGEGGAMTMSAYEGGPPLPPLPTHLHGQQVKVNGGPKGLGAQRVRQQTLPPQLTMTTVSGTLEAFDDRGKRPGRQSLQIQNGRHAFEGPERGRVVDLGLNGYGDGGGRRGFEIGRAGVAMSEVGHGSVRGGGGGVFESGGNGDGGVQQKKATSLCDAGSLGVVVNPKEVAGVVPRGREPNVGSTGKASVTRSRSALAVRRDGSRIHLRERFSGVWGSSSKSGGIYGSDGGSGSNGGVAASGDLEEGRQQRQRKSPTVRDLAILPTQRVMRYVLLFRDLLAHTPLTSPSREIVEKAVDAAVRVAQKCDRAQGNAAFLRAR